MGSPKKDQATSIGKKCLRPRPGSRRKQIVMTGAGQKLPECKIFPRLTLQIRIVNHGRIDGDNRPPIPIPGKSARRVEVGETVSPPGGPHRQILKSHLFAPLETGMSAWFRNSTDKGLPSHKESLAGPHRKNAQGTVKLLRGANRKTRARLQPLRLCAGDKIVSA